MKTRHRSSLAFVLWLSAVSVIACGPKPNVTPDVAKALKIGQAVVIVGSVSHNAILANGIKVCDVQPCPPNPTHPLLSDANTKIVTDAAEDGLKVLKTSPDGWKAVVSGVLERVKMRLDASGHTAFDPYIVGAEITLAQLGAQ
jgi:phosphomannomutase